MNKIFFPQYKKGKKGFPLQKGLSILGHIQKAGIQINAECGGKGKCGKCIVRIEKGGEELNKKTKSELRFSLSSKERLACQAKVEKYQKDIIVFIKESGKYQILKEVSGKEFNLNPLTILRNGKVIHNGEVLDNYKGKIYGLAVDVGTTTLVFQIVDLQSGETVATIAKTNPQILYGGDVISRIEYAIVGERKIVYRADEEIKQKIRELQKCVITAINDSLKKFKALTPYIYEAVVVGNSTMRNIFFGLDIFSLGLRPYEPVHKEPITRTAKELSLKIFPKAKVYGPALIGGHAGADALADILSSGIYKSKKPSILIDIGTNGEVIIGNSKKIISATLPAGGAFEGANVSSGAGAVEGAIKNIKIKNGKVLYETIDNKRPAVGICGSGLIDLLAELLRCGIMDKNAKIKKDFKITDKIKLTQADIYQLVNAKAGLKTDQIIMLKHYGIGVKDLDKIYLSGGFGNYINVKNAIKLGLLPDAEDKIVKIGNGALEGAKEMLVSKESRETAEQIAKKIEHIKPNELEKDFTYLVAENMYFTDK
ncbi:MAG: ASKHA domain-containing protein [Candidatus Ratteibacteria bacterium]|nr:ASKHA domain-containing protein [Candidatus Ratteibacteria bacterium]